MPSRLQHEAAVDELRSRLAEAEAATASAEQRASSAEALVEKLRQLLHDANGLIQMSDRRKEILYSQVTHITPNHAKMLDTHQCCNRRGWANC
jgi:chromosome segregation ATPase